VNMNGKGNGKMRIIAHKNNSAWWMAKRNDATPRDIAAFAEKYRKDNADAWCVTVTEGVGWVSADHIRAIIEQTRAAGAVSVWVSDGTNTQCVWRK